MPRRSEVGPLPCLRPATAASALAIWGDRGWAADEVEVATPPPDICGCWIAAAFGVGSAVA